METAELKITSNKIQKALDFATKAHEGAFRKAGDGTTPYVSHPIEVATFVQKYHPENENAIIGALLHDTVEDCDEVTFEVIEKEFGSEIANIVRDVTDDESDLQDLPKDELKKVRRQRQIDNYKNICFEAKLIRLGDKISNVGTVTETNKSIEWQTGYINFIKDVYEELKDIDSPMVSILEKEIILVEKQIGVDND